MTIVSVICIFDIVAIIRTHQEIQYLLYAGFFIIRGSHLKTAMVLHKKKHFMAEKQNVALVHSNCERSKQ